MRSAILLSFLVACDPPPPAADAVRLSAAPPPTEAFDVAADGRQLPLCPFYAPDTDGDGVCDAVDACPGADDHDDADLDGVPDACDHCEGFDDLADADHDGLADACDDCPDGEWAAPVVVNPTVEQAEMVEVADLDGDGDLDLMASGWMGDVSVAEALAPGQFAEPRVVMALPMGTRPVGAADLDGDGDLDVYASSAGENDVVWIENLGNLAFGPVIHLGPAGGVDHATVIRVGDWDADGDIDLVTTARDDHEISLFENLGGTFAPQQILGVVPGAHDVGSIDMDGDGDLDLLWLAQEIDGIGWIENLGDGDWGQSWPFSFGVVDEPHHVEIADLDGDGHDDVVVTGYSDGTVCVWFGEGAGEFAAPTVVADEFSATNQVRAADLDGDGDLDLVYANYKSDLLGVVENLGGRQLQVDVRLEGALGAVWVAPADIDQDGWVDVLTANRKSGTIELYQNGRGCLDDDGDGLAPGTEAAIGTDPDVADTDGDGTSDGAEHYGGTDPLDPTDA